MVQYLEETLDALRVAASRAHRAATESERLEDCGEVRSNLLVALDHLQIAFRQITIAKMAVLRRESEQSKVTDD